MDTGRLFLGGSVENKDLKCRNNFLEVHLKFYDLALILL